MDDIKTGDFVVINQHMFVEEMQLIGRCEVTKITKGGLYQCIDVNGKVASIPGRYLTKLIVMLELSEAEARKLVDVLDWVTHEDSKSCSGGDGKLRELAAKISVDVDDQIKANVKQ